MAARPCLVRCTALPFEQPGNPLPAITPRQPDRYTCGSNRIVHHDGNRLASLSRGHDGRGSAVTDGALFVAHTKSGRPGLAANLHRGHASCSLISLRRNSTSNSETDFAVGMARPFLDSPCGMFCNPFLAFHLAVTSAVHRQLQRHAVFGCDAEFHFLTDGWRTDQANGQNDGFEHLVPPREVGSLSATETTVGLCAVLSITRSGDPRVQPPAALITTTQKIFLNRI